MSNFQSSRDNDNTRTPFLHFFVAMRWEFVVSKNYDDNNVVPLCELRGTRIEVLFKLGKLKFRKAESLSQLLVSLYNFHYLANCSNFTRFLVSLVRILSIRRIQSMILRSPFRRRSINENWVISEKLFLSRRFVQTLSFHSSGLSKFQYSKMTIRFSKKRYIQDKSFEMIDQLIDQRICKL